MIFRPCKQVMLSFNPPKKRREMKLAKPDLFNEKKNTTIQ